MHLACFFPTVSSRLIKGNNSSSKPCLAHSLKTPEFQQCYYNKGNESFIRASICARDLQGKEKIKNLHIHLFLYLAKNDLFYLYQVVEKKNVTS